MLSSIRALTPCWRHVVALARLLSQEPTDFLGLFVPMASLPGVEATHQVADAPGAIHLQAAFEIAFRVHFEHLRRVRAEGIDELHARPDFQLGLPDLVDKDIELIQGEARSVVSLCAASVAASGHYALHLVQNAASSLAKRFVWSPLLR